MKGNPVGWFEIYVKDMSRAKTFYESVFDVKLAQINTPEPSVDEIWSMFGSPSYAARNAVRNFSIFSAVARMNISRSSVALTRP